ncbi:MAG: LysR substrate-binding domain-containing protein [Alphaproteobacteria bacterium]
MPILLQNFPSFSALVALESVVRHGSFASAGRELNVSQVAVNKKVAELEDWLGVKLVIRQKPRITVTPDAERIAGAFNFGTTRIKDELDSLKRRDRTKTRVTVYMSTAFFLFWLSPRLHLFHEAHPEIEINIISGVKGNRFDLSECDLAISYASEDANGHKSFDLFRDRIKPVASPAYLAARPSENGELDMSTDTILTINTADRLRVDWNIWLETFGMSPEQIKRRENFNDYGVLIHSAIDGHGVALGYCRHLSAVLDSGRLVELGSREMQTPGLYKLLVSSSREHDDKSPVGKFTAWMLDEAAKCA